MGSTDHRVLQRYVPRVASEWDFDAAGRRWREIDSSLCFIDLSGFTSLSERLAKRGRIGAEELTEVLNRVFGNMLGLAYERGGSLLKFGGDALLLHFTGDDHPAQAASSAVEMRAALREAALIPTSVGRVALRMSVGIHSGPVLLFRVGELHRELMITGDAATTVATMEAAAEPGEILVSAATAALLPAQATGEERAGGKLLRWRRAPVAPCGVRGRRRVTADDVVACLPSVLRRALADGHIEPEHRMATVGFVRFQGIEALLRAGGPNAVADALHELITTIQRIADAEEVTFLASDVDKDGCKVILTTGVPATQDDDDGRMLRALRHIVDSDSPLRLCAGVNRGHVFAGEVGSQYRATFTVMGDTVNIAARLMASAGDREIYASPAVVVRSRTPFTVTPLPPLPVKGKAEPLAAVSVGPEADESTGTGNDPIPADTSVFVGRDEEVARIGRAIERARTGAGSVLRIVGPTGIGKSRLVAETLAGTGATTVWMRGDPTGRATPYRAVRAPIRRLLGLDGVPAGERAERLVTVVGERAPALEPLVPLLATVVSVDVPDTAATAIIERRFRPDRTADVLIELLVAVDAPALVVVADDAQWFDSASSALVERIGRAAHEHGWVVLVTRRPDAGGCDPVPDEQIDLVELTPESAAALVTSSPSTASLLPVEIDAIVQRSGGNPLFLHELVRAAQELGVDQLPESLQDAVNAELDALGGVARRLVRCASVLGNSFPTDILRQLVIEEHIDLDAATAGALARFLDGDGRDGLRFRHGSMREVVYEGLTYRRRRELHLRAGEIVERVAGDDPESAAEVLSMHAALGQDHERAWRFARIAADRARSRYANVEAATHYRRALDAARRLHVEPADAIVVWRHLGDVEEQLGSFDRALEAYRRALALAEAPVARADVLWRRATVRMHLGQYRHALADATRARRLLDDDPDPQAAVWRARLISLQAWLRQAQQRAGAARHLALEAAEAAQAAGDGSALARSHLVLDWAHRVLGHADADGLGERALEIYEELGDLDGVAKASNNLGALAYFEGDWERAANWYRRAIEACRRSGNEIAAAVTASNLGELLVSRRQFDDARAILTDAIRSLRAARSVDDLFFAELQIGRLLLEDGAHDEAAAHLARVRDEAAAVGQSGYAFEAAALGACALVGRARYEQALEVLDEAARAAGDVDVVYQPLAARARALALMGLGRTEEALATATQGCAIARDQELLYDEALLLLTIDELRGESSEETLALFDRLGIPVPTTGPAGRPQPA